MKNRKITQITVINVAGVKIWAVGDVHGHRTIKKIELADLLINGDPFEHYIGFDENSDAIFTLNCLVPCEVVYS